MTDIVERLRAEGAMSGHYDAPAIQREAADEITRLRADLLKAEMQAEIAGLEGVMRGIAIGRREGIDAAIVACGGVFTDDKGVWANGFTRGVIEAQASIRALLTDRER